jgi:hypothetical protein
MRLLTVYFPSGRYLPVRVLAYSPSMLPVCMALNG